MNRKLALVLGAFLMAAAVSLPAAGADTMSNADVVEMTGAGLAPDIVIAAINASPTAFDLSTRAILQLNESGVNDQVIKAMLESTLAQPPAPPNPASAAEGERLRAELANLASGSPEAREAALAWFVANRDTAAPELRSFLSEANPANRAAAALALGRIGDARSVGAIRNLLTDPAPEARRSAAQALSLLGDQPAVMAAEQAIQRGINPIDGYIRLVGYAKLTHMAASLGQILASDPDTANRTAAAWALGEIGRAGVAGRPALERALSSDAESGVRREAALALAKFNDSAAAASLQNACSLDPAVRKTTLTALADYPEALEFLIGVMGLAADQIAIDETEAARTSLVRLTGQDFGLDGQRWREWYAANGARFAAASPAPLAAPVAPDPLASFDPALAATMFEAPAAPAGHVDMMEAWSIVADSAAIPTAPIPGETGAAPSWSGGSAADPALPGGVLTGTPGGGTPWSVAQSGGTPWSSRPTDGLPSWSSQPAATGEVDVSGSTASLSPGGLDTAPTSIPMTIPDVDVPADERAGGGIASGGPAPSSAPGTSGLRTWSSDPDRLARGGEAPSWEGDAAVPGWTPILQDVRSTLAVPPGQAGGETGGGGLGGDSAGSLSSDTVFMPPSAAPAPSTVFTGPAMPADPDADVVSGPPSLLGRPLSDDDAPYISASRDSDPEDEEDAYSPGMTGFGDRGPVLDPNPYADLSDILGSRLPYDADDEPDAPSLDNVLRTDSNEPWSIASGGSVPAAPPALPEIDAENYIGSDPYADWSATQPDPASSLETIMPSAEADAPWSVAGGGSVPSGDPYAEWSAGLPEETTGALAGQDDVTRVEDPYEGWQEYDGDAFPADTPAEATQVLVPPALEGEPAAPDVATGDTPAEMFADVDPAAVAESETPADPGYRTDLFVEIEPGQIVITDDFPQGRPMMEVPQPSEPMPAPEPFPQVAAPAPAPVPVPAPAPLGDTLVVETVPGGEVAVEAAPGTTVVVEPDAVEAAPSSPAAPFRSSSPVAVEPPPASGQGQDFAGGGPQTQYLAPPPPQASDNGAAGFMDPSKPLPPVKPEGTIAAPSGKTVPLLGEGFF